MRFDFVDRIDSFEEFKTISGRKLISLEEYFLLRPHGLKKTFPGTLLIESVFQLGNWLIFLSTDFQKMGFITMFQKMEILRNPTSGEQLLMTVEIEKKQQDLIVMNGSAFVQNEKIFQGSRCFVHLDDLDSYLSPADLKVKFSEIYRQNTDICR